MKRYQLIIILTLTILIAFTFVSYATTIEYDGVTPIDLRGFSTPKNQSNQNVISFYLLIFSPLLFLISLYIYSALENRKRLVVYKGIKKDSDIKIDDEEEEIKIKKKDPDFSKEIFLLWAEEIYIKTQTALSDKEVKSIRIYQTPNLVKKCKKQIQVFINNNTTNVIEQISIKNSILLNFYEQGHNEVLSVRLKVKQIDYLIQDESGQVLSGSKLKERNIKCFMTFMRLKGTKTTNIKSNNKINCPSCGGPNNLTISGSCKYCNSMIKLNQTDWLLEDIEFVEDIDI